MDRFYHFWRPISVKFLPIAQSNAMEGIIMTCIIANTIVLAVEHPFMSRHLEQALCSINVVSPPTSCLIFLHKHTR